MFIYYLDSPIDFRWEIVQTIDQVLARANAAEGAVAHFEILNAWERVKKAARLCGWEGDFRHPPGVCWIPSDGMFIYAFVFKQNNNGGTFVASPVQLPWLAGEEFHFHFGMAI